MRSSAQWPRNRWRPRRLRRGASEEREKRRCVGWRAGGAGCGGGAQVRASALAAPCSLRDRARPTDGHTGHSAAPSQVTPPPSPYSGNSLSAAQKAAPGPGGGPPACATSTTGDSSSYWSIFLSTACRVVGVEQGLEFGRPGGSVGAHPRGARPCRRGQNCRGQGQKTGMERSAFLDDAVKVARRAVGQGVPQMAGDGQVAPGREGKGEGWQGWRRGPAAKSWVWGC